MIPIPAPTVRARAKISWQVVCEICRQIARTAEEIYDTRKLNQDYSKHAIVAEAQSISTSGRILLVDGFTITADTPENQAAFPQNPAQKEGLGFPIIRGGKLNLNGHRLLTDLSLGTYAGKQSGETALLWQMLNRL